MRPNQSLLKLLVMQRLLESPSSGYQLVKAISEATGWKPSFGSVYPLLERLQEEDLVTMHAEGRSKIYALTALGKETFLEQQEQLMRTRSVILEQLHVLARLGDETAETIAGIVEELPGNQLPLQEVPQIYEMRRELYRLVKEKKIIKEQAKLRRIFGRTADELRKL